MLTHYLAAVLVVAAQVGWKLWWFFSMMSIWICRSQDSWFSDIFIVIFVFSKVAGVQKDLVFCVLSEQEKVKCEVTYNFCVHVLWDISITSNQIMHISDHKILRSFNAMFEQAMHSIVSKRWPLILMMDRTLHGRPKKTKTMMIGRSEATSEQSGAQSPIQAGSLLFHCSPLTKGRFWRPNRMHFWKSYKGGVRGSFSIQKFILQILGTLKRFFFRLKLI